MASTTADMSLVCRCCLQKEKDLVNIFKEIGKASSLSFAALVKNCVGLKITVGDGLPDHICTKCSKEASNFFNFKKMCLKTDQLLRPSAVVEFEPLKEVACQTDGYHNVLKISAYAVDNFKINTEGRQDSVNEIGGEFDHDGKSLPRSEKVKSDKIAQGMRGKDVKKDEVNTEGSIDGSLSVKLESNQSHLNKSSPGDTLNLYSKDTSEKRDGGTKNSNNAIKDIDNLLPGTEVQGGVMDEDVTINTPDLPLSDESIFTVLDISKGKDTDVIEVNELGEVVEKLSSCNSQLSGDLEDWLEGDEAKKERGAACNDDTSAQLSNSSLGDKAENCDRPCSADDAVVTGVQVIEQGKALRNQVKNFSSVKKNTEDDDVVMLEELKIDKNGRSQDFEADKNKSEVTSEPKEASEDKLKPTHSVEGKLTVKSIEALTVRKCADQASEEDLKMQAEPKEDLTLGNLLRTSHVNEIGVDVEDTSSNLQSSQMNDRTLGQIISMSLDKSSVKVFKVNNSNEDDTGEGSESSLCQGAEDTNDVEESSDSGRKRLRTSKKESGDVEDGLGDPGLKKQRITELSALVEEGGTTKETDTGDNEDSNSNSVEEGVETKEKDVGDTGEVNEVKTGDSSAIVKNKEGIGLEEEASEQLKDDSEDGIVEDDDSGSDSSGSEYVPAASPARSDESLTTKTSLPKSKSHEKSQISKLREQGYNIRECSVVLSDIAHPGSNTLSTSGSVSSQLSASSRINESDSQKEPEETSHHTSTCTAWIKVESETAMEEMDEEALEEGNAVEEKGNVEENVQAQEVQAGSAWHIGSNNDVAAAQTQGISADTQRPLAKFVSGRKRFLCPFCAKAFRTKNQMMLHRSLHTGDLPFPCEVCGKRFPLRCRLLRHMSVHDASINCEFCGMDFKTHILLGRHIKAKHTIPSYSYGQGNPHPQVLVNKSGQRFPCRMCPKVFSTINGLKVHKRVHVNTLIRVSTSLTEERIPTEENKNTPIPNTCKICGMTFPNALYLKSHMVCHNIIRPNSGKVNSIENSKPSESTEENQRMGTNLEKSGNKTRDEAVNVMEPTVLIHESPSSFGESSYQHQNPQYSRINQFVCSVCSQIFQSRSQLLRHQTLIHRSLKCEICACMFSSAEQVQSHKLSEHPSYNTSQFSKKPHKCTVCDKGFPKRSRLVQHMAVHNVVQAPVSCEVCGKYFAKLELLNMHKKTHDSNEGMASNSVLTCSVCHRVFAKRSRLKRHMLLHESQSFPCAKCSKTFISQELLTEHEGTHSAPPSEAEEQGVACTACGRMFANKGRLKQHVVVHTKSGYVSCNTCFKVFANKQVLEMHAQTCANADESSTSSQSATNSKSALIPHPSSFTSCTCCNKAFPSKELLTEHEKTCVGLTVVKKLDGTWKVLDSEDRSRGAVKPSQSPSSASSTEAKIYACKVCNKRFNNYHGLNSHMRFHQESVGIYKCELCHKKFSSRNKLSQHMSSHTAVYRCGICSQAFGMVDELKKHVGQCMAAQSGITPNYFFCNGCSEVFNLLEELAQHVKCHADEFPHTCTECFQVFAHATQLNRHITTHIKEERNKHTCHVCQKTFGHNAALGKHMVVHTGEKRFHCPYCFQRFSQKSSLNRHQLTQHETKS